MDQASSHFSFAELTHTNTGLDNVPNADEGAALVRLADICLEPMRLLVGPLTVDSGFRCPAVNSQVGGVSSSQHLHGEAADLVPAQVSPSVLFDLTHASAIPFDQLILEFGWVHVSTAPLGKLPRRQALKARKANGKTVYDEVF